MTTSVFVLALVSDDVAVAGKVVAAVEVATAVVCSALLPRPRHPLSF